jgi:hypothetical protein
MTEKYKHIIETLCGMYCIEERKEIVAALQATYDPKMEVIESLNSFKFNGPVMRAGVSKMFVKMSVKLWTLRHIPLFEDFEFRTAIGEFYVRFPENYPWYRTGKHYSKQWNNYVNHLIKIVQAGRCLRKQDMVE